MKKTSQFSVIAILCFSIFLSIPASSWAKGLGTQTNSEYEELTYDDLVNQLSEKRVDATKMSRTPEVRTHLGFGMASSFNQLTASGKSYNVNLSGYEVSYGADLNSDKVRGEMAVRWMPESESGSVSASLREFNGLVSFRRDLKGNWRSKFAGGLAIRFLGFADSSRNINMNETSSMFVGATGLETSLSSHAALSGDLSLRSPFGSATPEKQSLSFGIKLDTTFE